KDWLAAVDFVNRITPVAEAEGHHPDLYVRWGEVRAYLWTHKIKASPRAISIWRRRSTGSLRQPRARAARRNRPHGRVITLIHGGESYLVDRATRDLLQPLRSGLTLEFNYEDLQADGLSADAFAEKASTLPFIDAVRVLVLRDWGLLAGKRDKGAGAERAAAYLE